MYRHSAAKTDLVLRHFSDDTLPRLVHTFASFPSLPSLAWLQSFFTQFERTVPQKLTASENCIPGNDCPTLNCGNLRALEIKHGYSNKQGLIPC